MDLKCLLKIQINPAWVKNGAPSNGVSRREPKANGAGDIDSLGRIERNQLPKVRHIESQNEYWTLNYDLDKVSSEADLSGNILVNPGRKDSMWRKLFIRNYCTRKMMFPGTTSACYGEKVF